MNKFLILGVVLVSLGLTYGKPLNGEVKEVRDYIVVGKNLPNEDKDSSDPFLVVRNAAGNEIYRSDTSENNLNPVFAPALVINFAAGDIYEFEVRDEDSLNPDDTLGKVSLVIDDVEGEHTLSTGASIQVLRL